MEVVEESCDKISSRNGRVWLWSQPVPLLTDQEWKVAEAEDEEKVTDWLTETAQWLRKEPVEKSGARAKNCVNSE